MSQNDISNSDNAFEVNQQDFFSDDKASQQENFNSDPMNGDFVNIQSKETEAKEISSQKKQSYQKQIQELVNQLKINEEHHAKILKEYQLILADKDRLVEEKKRTLERINESHSKRVELLIRTQQQALTTCRMQHKMEIAKLERQLQQQEMEAKGVAVEQVLNNFEQEQHTLRIDCIQNIPTPISSPFELKSTTTTTTTTTANKNTPYTSPLYIPSHAISWPPPPSLSSLRKPSTTYSQKD